MGAFAAAALAAVAGLPAPAAAWGLGLFVLVVTAWHPANGVAAVVLASAFLLGEHKTPYFLLGHATVLAVFLSGLVHLALGRLPGATAPLGTALCFVAAAVLAVPLNVRDLLEDLWLVRWLDWTMLSARGIPDVSHLKYLERAGVLAFGVGLFAVASRPVLLPATVAVIVPLTALVGILSAFGLLRFFGIIQTAGEYLTLSFWTWKHPDLRLTAVAWSPDYFAQFLVLTVPLALALIWARGPAWQRVLGAGASLVGVLALAFTFQRAAYAALVVALASLVLLRWWDRPRGTAPAWGPAGVAAIALVLVVAALDRLILHGRVVARLAGFATDPNRIHLWAAALRMVADQPLLGVGAGRYAFFFREYADPKLLRDFGPFWGTAHSTYLHILAEQGVVGLASFLAFFAGVWLTGFRRLGALPEDRQIVVEGLLASLTGWFAYAAVQYVFRVDALTYLVCVLAGTVVALAPPARRPAGSRPWWLVGLVAGLLLLGFRLEAAFRRPVTPGYEAGFYHWERQADGTPARWATGRAAMTTPVGGAVIVLRLAAPLPGIEARPQVVRVWIDRGAPQTVRLASPKWLDVVVPVRAPRGSHVLVELESRYTVVPSRIMATRDQRALGVMIGEVAWRDG